MFFLSYHSSNGPPSFEKKKSCCLIRRFGICEVSELKDNSKCTQVNQYLRQPGLFFGGIKKEKKGHSRCVEPQRWEGHSGPVSKFRRQGGIATKHALTCLSHMPLSPVGLRRSRQWRAAYGSGTLLSVCLAFCRLHRVPIVHPVIPSFS